ncbi:GGDEF domain-containing protein [Marinicella litoralis]|uniref:Diguanylate cyclase (GGDEF)-like protein n=1 Tax=Marinicella litoralis TaxID=644220 RepID=A0A4V3DH43_9GAMM|nr:GGDEF domain-containing protein [Marinicella litoralis]TDR16801.1 diguanylate cyclase (GGDEF)-like protein [Marinicella litoralis]
MNQMKAIIDEEMKLINQLMNSMVLVWMFLSTFALIFTLLRTELTGWGGKENMLILIYIAIMLVAVFRNRLSPYIKVFLFIASQVLVAILGVLEFGFMAPAILFLPMTVMLLACFYKQAVILFFAGLVLVFISWAAYAFHNGYLSLSPDANVIFMNVEHWVVYIICLANLLLFLPISIYKYRNNMNQLLFEVMEQKKEIEHLANHDFLTGLPLIKLCMSQFDAFLASDYQNNKHLAMLFLDIDKFKLVLDQYGHDAGDICLIHVANKLSKEVRSAGFACRLGGDEFMVLLNTFKSKDELIDKAERIVSEVSSTFKFRGKHLSVGVSVGIALFGEHGKKFHDLKRAADRAMYQAKSSNNNSICFAEPEAN